MLHPPDRRNRGSLSGYGSAKKVQRAIWLVLLCVPGWLHAAVPDDHGLIRGRVEDAVTGEPLAWVQLLLEELSRSTVSREDGSFEFRNVPDGRHTIKTFRIGYDSFARSLQLNRSDTLNIVVRLSSSAILGNEIVVEGYQSGNASRPAIELNGSNLRRNLGGTLAETLKGLPGLAMRSMGPAPARPVIRGMSGDRLLLLEDGGLTGDLSHTSSDHAVAIEPLNAERIEVIRGPASLEFGSSTLGGVINVIRNYIPDHPPESTHGGATLQTETVNSGYSAGFVAGVPVANLAVHLDGSIRQAQDMRTPEGRLQNTQLTTGNGTLGLSRPFEEGYVGAAFGHYNTSYGIPGGFVGAHPEGVDIKMYRNQFEVRGQYTLHIPTVSQIEGKLLYTYLFQQEFERSDLVGVEFAVGNVTGNIKARTRNLGPFRSGFAGVSIQSRDFKSGGFAFTPFTVETSASGFLYQEMEVGAVQVESGLRFDWRSVSPETVEESRIGDVRERHFGGFSGSVLAQLERDSGVSARISVTRSLRMPAVEELFSEGPHLAAYSYDIGNPDLGEERGTGLEAGLSYSRRGFSIDAAVFLNRFSDYIFLANTGEINVRTLLPIYRYGGTSARLAGGELGVTIPLIRTLSLRGNASFVSGRQVDDKQPLPLMPPLSGGGSIQYRSGQAGAFLGFRAARKQDQLGMFESETDGFLVVDAGAQYHVTRGGRMHAFDLVVQNALNEVYRDHLSRVKSILPEPGINLKLLYKLYF